MSFRARLIVIAGTAAAALIGLLVAGMVTSRYTAQRMDDIQERYLPKLELGPRLGGQLERLQRAFQDAVAARDADALVATRADETRLLDELNAAVPALTVGQVVAVRGALDDYYQSALDVSRRLIAGETGERLVDAMSAMQAKQVRATDLLATATNFDRRELARAFADAQKAQRTMTNVRLSATLVCLALMLLLSFWMGRSLIRSLADVAVGLRRFGAGELSVEIPIVRQDEIGDLAARANQMAANLRRASEDRDRNDWIKGALAGLNRELRGELEPSEVGTKAVRFISDYLGAPLAALYYFDDDGALALLGQYAGGAADQAPRRIRPGEGLVGQAALSDQVMIVAAPPADYFRVRSGLGEAAPRAVALVPLEQFGRVRGVLELGLFSPWTDRLRDALLVVRETLVIAIEVARARAKLRDLLAETQRQAERLLQQEEELRSTNEELQTQQEELRQTNEELTEQAEELETQRRALERNNVELEQARASLEKQAAELATVSAYKSQFLANMSHELRTPLNSMLLLSNLLAENEARNLTEKQVEFASTIHTAGKDLLRLINQVLDLAKIEAGKQEVSLAPVPLRQMAERLERVFRPLADDKRLELRVLLDETTPEVIDTDGQRLEQILGNLLGNAIKFTERGRVTLRITKAGSDRVAFAVADTGLGIAAADQQRIFAPFEQVDGAIDRRYGGTGLGLSISRELARLLGGTLALESAPGKGSTFSLTLPLRPDLGEVAPPPDPVPASPVVVGNATFLVIEDDLRFAEAVAEVIRAQGLECLVASDGKTGLRLARQHIPVGIVLDVKLPDIDGWRVMEELRFDRATARIPVHFVSGTNGADRGLALGAVGYLMKPASREDILTVVRRLSAQVGDGADRVLVVEDDPIAGDAISKHLTGERLQVRRAITAAQAMNALESESFGCIVLDLSLPDMDGVELLQKLRKRHGANLPQVVIYTARTLSAGETKALEADADAVVLKDGASAERLLDEVRLFTRRLKEGLGSRRAGAALVHPADLKLAGRRVLVADDDMRTAYALSATLRAKGVEVHVADTGRAALEQLDARGDVEAVLMDVMMPEMDGLEAMRRIRKDPRFQNLPIIALTAKVMKGDEEMCLAAGASGYLPKPVDGDRLLAMLNGMLARVESNAG